MKCKFSAVENKEVIIKWFKGPTKRLKKGGRINIIDEPQRYSSILEIKNSVSSDSGIYTCKVIGPKGNSDSRLQMIFVVGE